MKIAHVLHPYQPDLGYQENYLPAKQRKLGHDARIFTSNYVPAEDGDNVMYDTGRHEYKSVPTYRLETRLNVDSMEKVYLKGLRSALATFDPDVIHAHGLYSITTLQCALYALLDDVELFVDVHVDNDNIHIDTPGKKLLFGSHRLLGLPFLTHAARLIFPVNPRAREFLIDELGVSAEQVEFLPLGVDTEVFYPKAATAEFRTQLGFRSDQFVIISSGNLNETKDLDVLIRAFGQVQAKHPEARLLLVGPCSDEYQRSLEGLISAFGLEEFVQFEGRVPHERLAEYYNAADIGAWAGKLGITIIEAIGCGLPVVVCESNATSFLVANDNGLRFDRGDVSELAARLTTYLSDPDIGRRHEKNAESYATERLSWDTIAEESIRFYRAGRKNRG
jgi:glycosyltransferase involved in cell wall biosynthesis